ncbi:TPA: hypothetical protein EYP66_09845 [Candidatus Poribacteria bacterium]|nr:hypothetical protein [Candidatus Poribacteria bacterium]
MANQFFSIGNAHAANWEIVREGKWDTNFHDIYFLNENVGWAVGSRGVIAHTEDGGLIWNRQRKVSNELLEDMDFVEHELGWVAGSAFDRNQSQGIILHTSDGGDNFQVQFKQASQNGI